MFRAGGEISFNVQEGKRVMQTGIGEAAFITVIMALVILFCRACPFLFFRGKQPGGSAEKFIVFVEKAVPPLAMTVLAFNTLSAPVYESLKQGGNGQIVSALAAAAVTVAAHLWKRNALLSIFSGTAVYMALERIISF